MSYNPVLPKGQASMANSNPVVIASDQATFPVTATATLSAETTKVIGVVRTADGSGNLLSSTANALDINVKSGSIANTSFGATLAAETTKVIGVVRTADGSGNLLTSTGNALDINIKTGSIANTTFGATLGAETTKVIGVVRTADGSGNLLTSTANALDINLKTGGITSVTADTELPTAAALADAASATPTTPTVGAIPLLMNSTTVDRAKSIINAMNTTGTGVAAAGMLGQLDDTSTGAVTENQFAPVRISSRRALLVEGVASGTAMNVSPALQTAASFFPDRLTDGTNFLDPATLFDLDTGGGVQYVAGINLRRGASGGSVEAGTTTYPIAIEKVDSSKTTYSAVAVAIAPAASATDVFTITGTASKTVRVLRVGISGTQTTAGMVNIVLAKRSTANSSGTSAAATAVPNDSGNAEATATVLSYTVNPTTGTLVGNVRAGMVLISGTASVAPNEMTVYDFGNLPGQCIVLRGTAQVLAVNLNGVTVTGGSMTYWVEWTEE